MKTVDVVGAAIANTFRSKTRTILTIVAIFIGAFTLTITTGLGVGINSYITRTVSELGTSNVMTVTHPASQTASPLAGAPATYDPDAVTTGTGRGASTVDPITPDDLTQIGDVPGVISVAPVKQVSVKYVQAATGDPLVIGVGAVAPGVEVSLSDGAQPDAAGSEAQVAIPDRYVEPLGFADAGAALGQTVTFGLADATNTVRTVTATVVGVSESSGLAAQSGASGNAALIDALWTAQHDGAATDTSTSYPSATVTFDPTSSSTATADLRAALEADGYAVTTLSDTLGAFETVIDVVVLILNAFAVIALLAAGFGIVNTLFMSVQERTREIGLMKAMGMGSGRIFALFSYEAVFIGFLGSAIGVGVGLAVGFVVGGRIAAGLSGNLPGLTLFGFDAVSVAGIVVLVMAIAFLAGTLPAARAARADPIESLRYE